MDTYYYDKAVGILLDMLEFSPTTDAALEELKLMDMPRVRFDKSFATYKAMRDKVGGDNDMWYCWGMNYCMGIKQIHEAGDGTNMIELCGARGKEFYDYGQGRNIVPDTWVTMVPWEHYIIQRYSDVAREIRDVQRKFRKY